jgi:YHS domain-containing protein
LPATKFRVSMPMMKLKSSLRAAFVAGLVLAGAGLAAAPASASKPLIYTELFSNVAAGGYDVVAYFTDGRPVRGLAQFRATWQGAEFRFATAEHQRAFLGDPQKYTPQFGGYCAWAAAQGYTAKGDPNFWKIVNGKLYLNFNGEIQRRWEQDVPGNIARANGNWPRIIQ